MTLAEYIKNGKEILHFEDPNEARDWANRFRDKIKNTPNENLVSVSAEGYRVILALKHTVPPKRKLPAYAE